MQFALREFRDEDFSTLLHIDQSCFVSGIAYTSAELKTYIFRRNSFTFVAETSDHVHPGTQPAARSDSNHILGFIVAERNRALGHIITIDVLQEARRHRIGSVLLSAAESQLGSWKCSKVQLETAVDNIAALTFYKRHGYSVIKTVPRYYSNGVDALLLEKDLLSPPSSS